MTDANLLASVKKQVEFYFSDSAYRRDTFLRTAVANDSEGFVPITTLLTFNKLKQLTTDVAVVAEALKDSETVIVSDDKTKLKRSEPLPDVDDSALRTLYVKGYPTDDAEVTIDSVREQLSVYGPINYVKLRRETGGENAVFKGSVFVEFSKEEDLQKAYKAANEGGSVQLSYKGTPFLCVIPFNEWHKNHQNKLKKTGKRKHEGAQGGKEDADADDKDEDFVKGLLLEVGPVPSDVFEKTFREFLKNHAEVAYVEKVADSDKVIVRLKSSEEVEKLTNVINQGLKYPETAEQSLTVTAVTGDAEKDFYERLKSNQGKSHGGRGGGRGGRGGGRGGRGGKRQRR